MPKKRPAEKKTYAVPYSVTFTGDVWIEAHSAEEAKEIAGSGGWDDDTFTKRASISDWKVLGDAREVR